MTGVHAPASERLDRRLVTTDTGCLEWTGATNDGGYGRIKVNGENALTHQLAWELTNGPIPEGLCVLHHCDNPPCCQTEPTEDYPDGHLFLGTRVDNNADRDTKGRHAGMKITHCPDGHEYTEANTYVCRKGHRSCRACNNARARARRAA